MGWYLVLLVVLAVFIVPFMLGSWLARRFRLPDHGWKIGLVLFIMVSGVLINYAGWPPKLGVDLSGGVILVYEVDQEKKDPTKPVDMPRLIEAVSRRVNPGGQKEMVVRQYGQEQIEIILPKASDEEVRDIERTISRAGTLAFRILANQKENARVVDLAMETPGTVVRDREAKPEDPPLGWWVPVEAERAKEFSQGRAITREVKRRNEQQLQVLVVYDPYNVTGDYLRNAQPGVDQKGNPCVEFTFTETGGQLFSQLTGENVDRPLGIILDNYLYSAPNIITTISDRGQITGSFTQEEVKSQVSVLLAGGLPAALTEEPLSRMYSGATLGADTITKSSYSMIISSILVLLFMLWYYRFSGIVADLALTMNIVGLVAVMILIKAPFTLPGLAGLALTVGMAVDNNVLVYERLREELERGAALRMAIRNAFQRASATIIDSNLTTIIAATVMYVIGTDQVKGFAVTLWLGVAISMFTAVFMARVIFDIAEKQQWITRLKMMKMIGVTHIDFTRLFPVAAVLSLVVTIGSLMIAGARGKSLFDIDFTGGVSVQILFKEPQAIKMVRGKVEDARERFLPDVAVSEVTVGGEQPGLRFVINTSNRDLDKVEEGLADLFPGQLQTNDVTVGPLTRIEAETPQASEAAATKPEATPSSQPLVIEPAPGAKPPAKPEAKESESQPPAARPAEKAAEKSAEQPATNPAEKKDDKQSRRDLPADSLLALADGSSLLLAQAKPEEKAADKAPPPAADQMDPKPAETKPAAESKPAEAAKPAETAKPQPAPAAPASPVAPTTPEPVSSANTLVGGTQAHLTFALPVSAKTVEERLNEVMKQMGLAPDHIALEISNPDALPGQSKAYDTWDVKVQLPQDKAQALFAALDKQLEAEPAFPASDKIGSQVAANTQWKAFYALVLSWFFMILYLWVRFQRVAFGVAAVVALIHDVLVMLGAIAISYYVAPFLGFLMIDPFKINLTVVAAFLTIIGFSVNDTIVIFDRIREIRGKDPHFTRKMVNDATNQTMSRTLLTSFTVLLVVVILYIFGGEAIHGFAFALLVGLLAGVYSTVYVASPILLWMIGTEKVRE